MSSMKYVALIILIVVFLPIVGRAAETWLVSNEMNGDFSSITAAIESDRVQADDVVLILPGIYEEHIRVPSCKPITLRSADGPRTTIIMPPPYTDNTKHMAVLLKGHTVFDGFTIMENPVNMSSTGDPRLLDLFGTGQPWPHLSTGIYSTGPADVKNNLVIGFRIGICSSCPSGAMGNPAYVRFNECHGNEIGVCLCETTNIVRDNFIHDNYWVGVLVSHGACGELANNLIIHNGTPGRVATAGILCWQDYTLRPELNMTPIICNNTVHGNRGPGLRCRYVRGGLCTPVVHHNIFSWNENYGILCETLDSDPNTMPYPIVHYCNFYNNVNGQHVNIPRVIGCLSVNPLFEDGFYLNPASPCIDAGMLPGTWGSVMDIDDLDRKHVDLGYHHPPKSGHSDPYPLND
ncbi:right-handed parallel beta-helix repeat-containing protein [bacterium]|nr:right-handed parallel beta-helix repeat-containing protein [candidate division CSSED10-310 bacterium]